MIIGRVGFQVCLLFVPAQVFEQAMPFTGRTEYGCVSVYGCRRCECFQGHTARGIQLTRHAHARLKRATVPAVRTT